MGVEHEKTHQATVLCNYLENLAKEEKPISCQALGNLMKALNIGCGTENNINPKVLAELGIPLSLYLCTKGGADLLPRKLQKIRKIRGISQRELAFKAGISPGLVGQLEMGKNQPSIRTLEKVCQVLDISLCSLLMDNGRQGHEELKISADLLDILYDQKVQLLLSTTCSLDLEKFLLVINFIQMLDNPVIV